MSHGIPFTAEQVRAVQSGEARGFGPGLIRFLMTLGTLPYAGAVLLKNFLFDTGLLRAQKVDAAVLSVGNLTTGGTGKTPLVCYLAEWLSSEGFSPLLVSRGYGAKDGQPNDEAKELAERLPDVPHEQGANRAEVARGMLTRFSTQNRPVILLDDAFQHRKIVRDLDIVVLDALNPWGYGSLLPRGQLREPAHSLKRAQVVALSRSDAVSAEVRAQIRQQVERHAPQATWIEMQSVPHAWQALNGTRQGIEETHDKPALAFCGIGNPQGFMHSLERASTQVEKLVPFPDHHHFTLGDLQGLIQQAKGLGVNRLVCTHKDLVKFPSEWQAELDHAGITLQALVMKLEIVTGREALEERLKEVLLSK
ncbi:MAG: tetraacyldisaccharide 4'-kinase [Planctomycetaceae bacterium]